MKKLATLLVLCFFFFLVVRAQNEEGTAKTETVEDEDDEEEDFYATPTPGQAAKEKPLEIFSYLLVKRDFLTEYLVAEKELTVSYYIINSGTGSAYNVNITDYIFGVPYNEVIPEIAPNTRLNHTTTVVLPHEGRFQTIPCLVTYKLAAESEIIIHQLYSPIQEDVIVHSVAQYNRIIDPHYFEYALLLIIAALLVGGPYYLFKGKSKLFEEQKQK